MIRIRPYIDSDEADVLSWCSDEKTFYRWTAGVLGDYPMTAEKFGKTAEIMRFTAIDEDKPVGFFTLRNPGGKTNELRFGFVIVNPEKRGKGTGRQMIAMGLKFVFDIYCAEKATIAVLETNTPAFRCYLSAGFCETGVKEEYSINGKTFCAVEMEYKKPYNNCVV